MAGGSYIYEWMMPGDEGYRSGNGWNGGLLEIGPGRPGVPPAQVNPLLQQQALRPPIRITATPQLALGPGGPGTAVATLDDLARQLVGGNPAAIPNGIPAGVAGQIPRITEFPTGALGAPGPTGPMAPPINQLANQLTQGGVSGARSATTAGGAAGGMSSVPVSIRSAAAGGIDDAIAGATAGGVSGLVGKLGRLPFPKSGIGKFGAGLGIGVAGNVLSGLTGGQESPIGRFFSGAGAGGGLGAMFGPQGAVIGGIAAGLGNALFGGGGDSDRNLDEVMSDLIQQTGLDPDTQSEFATMYAILKETTGDDKTAAQQVGQFMIQRMMEQENQQAAQAKLLATQALTAQFFQPFTQQLLDSAQQRAAIGENLAESLPENYRGIARMQNAAALDNATRTANAYAAQAQLLPAMATMEYQQGLANQLAQQQAAQSMQGGASSLTDLASQIAPQLTPASG